MKKLVFALLAAAMCFSSTAFAGGGPPQNFADLKYQAEESVQPQIDYYNQTGQLQCSQNTCDGWTNLTDDLMYYFMYEGKFRAKAAQIVTANSWAIKSAQKTGENISLVPTYKLNRLNAQKQISLMDQWHAAFETFYYWQAWGMRNYYCSQEQMCSTPLTR